MLPADYYQKSRDEKVGHWVGLIYRQMRWAGEDGCEERSVLDQTLLARMRSDDRDIDELMPSILTYLARMWLEPPATFVSHANERMGTNYPVDEKLAVAKFGIRSSV